MAFFAAGFLPAAERFDAELVLAGFFPVEVRVDAELFLAAGFLAELPEPEAFAVVLVAPLVVAGAFGAGSGAFPSPALAVAAEIVASLAAIFSFESGRGRKPRVRAISFRYSGRLPM